MDREKVKAFLQHLGMNAYEYKQADDTVCGYDYLEVERIADDALEILKEQEAVEPFHKCGKNFSLIENSHYDYCPYCGKPITWAKQEGR